MKRVFFFELALLGDYRAEYAFKSLALIEMFIHIMNDVAIIILILCARIANE